MDMRGGLTGTRAEAWITTTLSGTIRHLEEHPEGGWRIEMEEMDRYAVDLVEGHDHFHHRFARLSNEEGEDQVDYQESILQAREPRDGAPGVVIEGLYSRRLGLDRPQGSIEGWLALVPAHAWRGAMERMLRSHAERALAEVVIELDYATDGVRYARRVLKDGAADASGLDRQIRRLALEALEMGGDLDASQP